MKARVLYLEDDPTLGFLTSDSLRMHGYEVELIEDGTAALEAFKQSKFDLCIFDIVVPGLNGVELSKEIRSFNRDVPILFLSSRGLTEDRIEALKTGADDYLVKPFRVEELILKMEVFLRRSGKEQIEKEADFNFGQLQFIPSKYTLTAGAEVHKLTARETELLEFLWTRANQVVKREEILLQIWGDDDYFMGRSLDVFISRLRKYLKSEPGIQIENVHGVGFEFKTN
ncbi:MAG: response regulator transcription factor [Flavobacteriia bacterium]|nr:response regulator transcription factor [Flavobacteriia bacterium]